MYPSLSSNSVGRSLAAPRGIGLAGLRTAITLSLYTIIASQITTVQGQNSQCLQTRQTGPGVDPEAIWQTIQPGTISNLSWTPCYPASNFTQLCSRLTVPLDYAQPEGPSAIIALVKVPAAVNSTDAKYRGPILFNPGGPGGSGVEIINVFGGFFQQVIGDEYDIVGFDPRGVERTEPRVNIFPDPVEDAQWHIPVFYTPLFNTTPDAVPRIYADSLTLASVAEARIKDIGPYLGTAQVARDMLSITKAFGREKVQYWGFSYGTILGATFAAMFPDKVERLIIDGVVDADDYYTTSWKKNLLGTDKELLRIFQECADAGPDLCALHEPTAEAIHARYEKILENLKRAPVAVTTKGGTGPVTDYGVFEFKWAKMFLLEFLYGPYGGTAPAVMSALRALEDGDARPFWDAVAPFKPQISCTPSLQTPDALTAISCSDGEPVTDTPEELEKVFQELMAQSEFGDVWPLRSACDGWKFRPIERFAGPFVANTSFPLLLIGNTDDPVTPVVNAHTMSKGFSGSVVLTQNSCGHASIAAASVCTARAIRDYFRDGTLPKEGTVCEIESTTFNGTKTQSLVGRDSEDSALMDAWNGVNKGFRFKSPMLHGR